MDRNACQGDAAFDRHRRKILTAPGAAVVLVRQHRGNDCGIAALTMLVNCSGRHIEYHDVAGTVSVRGRGIDLLSLSKAAALLGLSTTGIRASYDDLCGLPLPAIAHVHRRFRGRHFVLVESSTQSHVVIVDPAAGRRTMSRSSFCRQWSGYLLTVENT